MKAWAIDGDVLSSLSRAGGWVNSPPLSAAGLRDKTVLVQFWTYTCINWLRTLPYIRGWAGKYKDLVVVGVHSPEFEFETDPANVRRAVSEMRIAYPVAFDPDHAIWKGFGNEYWPALYLLDGNGRIRYQHFGEGKYDEVEQAIQILLAVSDRSPALVEARGPELAADWVDLQSGENYLGYLRTEGFASPGGLVKDRSHAYAPPSALRLNQWALEGNWTMGQRALVAEKPGGLLSYQFHARDLHLVAGPGRQGAPVRFRVRIDGKPPGQAHGDDSDAAGNGIVTTPRLYQLIRQSSPIISRRFDIAFLDPGAEAFVFTFG